MNFNKVERKINDLTFRIKLDEIAIQKAQYNLKFAKRLGLKDAQIDKYAESLDFYNSRIITDRNTLSVLNECKNTYYGENLNNEGYLFKCTLPYEKVDDTSSFQTSILVNDNVAKLFANGVEYKDIVGCLDGNDIIDIDTTFSPVAPAEIGKNVDVEVIENIDCKDSLDEPILAYTYGKANSNLIASSKICTCYSFDNSSFKNLDGEDFSPAVPSLKEICSLQESTYSKEQKYNELSTIESAVKEKMQASIDKINFALSETNAGYSLGDNFLGGSL